MLTGKVPAADALGHILRDEMEVVHHRPEPTVLIKAPLEPEHYPAMEITMHPIPEGDGQQLLASGLEDLQGTPFWSLITERG